MRLPVIALTIEHLEGSIILATIHREVVYMPDKQRVLELVSAMPEGISYEEIVQALSIWFSDINASADIHSGRVFITDAAKQRVRELAAT